LSVVGIIPARYGSTRFPGKPLADVFGKSMISRVYEQAGKAKSLTYVYVATDDRRIFDHVKSFGGRAVLTSIDHRSGTDRCAEALRLIQKELPEEIIEQVVNIQGDEPFIDPSQIDTLVRHIITRRSDIATMVRVISTEEELFNSNVVKVVVNTRNGAVYFSRNPIPYFRSAERAQWVHKHRYYKHIGIYAYSARSLPELAQLSPTANEIAESLEQLRWIDHGYSISIAYTDKDTFGIDTPEDLRKISRKLVKDTDAR
jgi:3-deoxy-manno-octulosonate cytidylyltransferase (CMP-KDO synthetase)